MREQLDRVCSSLLEHRDIALAHHPNLTFTIRFEDLVGSNSSATIKALYAFLQMPLPLTLLERIHSQLERQSMPSTGSHLDISSGELRSMAERIPACQRVTVLFGYQQ